MCKLELETRQELILPYFFTTLQRGNFLLKLYYLWKMVAYGARDNCFSKRLIPQELSGAEAEFPFSCGKLSETSSSLWMEPHGRSVFLGRWFGMQKLAWYLQLLLKLIQPFKLPLKMSRQGANHDCKKFVFLCVFHLSVSWRNKLGISQFHYIDWNIIEIQTSNNLQGLKKSSTCFITIVFSLWLFFLVFCSLATTAR